MTSRELDAEVAEKVMGFRWRTFDNGYTRHNYLSPPDEMRSRFRKLGRDKTAQDKIMVLPYSTDIKAAWEVVEKMGPPFRLEHTGNGYTPWKAVYGDRGGAIMPTVPEAICRGALAAKAVSKESKEHNHGR